MWEDPSDEKEEKIIKRTAETIYKYDMDLVAILFLESMKPLASVGGQLARYMVAPFIPFIGDKSLPFFATFRTRRMWRGSSWSLKRRGDRKRKRRRG